MRTSRRVVITGLGVVAPNGIGKDAFWENLIAGKSAIDYITAFDASPYPCQVAAEVRNFNPAEFMTKKCARELWRFAQFALAAAQMAVDDAKLEIRDHNQSTVGVCFGTCVSGVERVYESFETVRRTGFSDLHPLTSFQYSTHAPAAHVGIELGIKGPAMTLASGCSTGLDVIKWGYDQIQAGNVTAVIAGSTEAPLTPMVYSTWAALGILTTHNSNPSRASRPYDLTRDGLVLGEGAGAVIVEDMESAMDRGAPIYAEIIGFGSASEALNLRKGDLTGEGLARAIRLALDDSGLSAQSIDYINSHGNSLPENDLAETNAYKDAFESRAYSIPISSIKSMIGQPIAASGILQAVSTALTVMNDVIPPTINYATPDPQCDLDYVPNNSRVARVDRALINAHAMGGTHSVLVVKKLEACARV
jgi:3-oxoacyl-[acyl-carrier-protein] synthase II